jgi:hypothetical protein
MAKTTRAADEAAPTLKVRALEMGYYEHVRRRPGDVFTIPAHAYNARWMARVPPSTPERVTTAQQAIQREHDAILQARTPGREDRAPTGAASVLGE